MKKLSRIMIAALVISSLSSVGAFAATNATGVTRNNDPSQLDPTMKTRVETLRAEGKTRTEIGEILKAEGFEIQERPDAKNHPKMSEEMKTRVETLREEGKTRAEIGEILKAEGFEIQDRPGGKDHPIMSEEMKTRVETLRAEGKTRAEIETQS